MTQTAKRNPEIEARRRWMRVLAAAPAEALESAWGALEGKPAYTFLRAPEIGSAMVRARAGGTGARFNLGEMTLTRCVVRLDDGTTGFAYVAGRDRRKTELAAAFDALMQAPARRDGLEAALIAPLETKHTEARTERSRKVGATRVDFFTMVRGDS